MTDPQETQPPGLEDGWLIMDEYDPAFDEDDTDA